MPWTVQKQDDQFCIVADDSGETVACHDTQAEATAQLRALYASEPKAAVEPVEPESPNADTKLAVEGDGDAVTEALSKVKNPLGVLWMQPAVPIDENDPPDPEVIRQIQSSDLGKAEVASAESCGCSATAAATPALDALMERPEQWHAVSLPLGVRSGDGRTFLEEGASWRELPTYLKWAPESYGEHLGAFVIGATTRRELIDGAIHSWGCFALDDDGDLTDDAADAVTAVRGGMLSGTSVEVDDVTDADIEMVWPATVPLEEVSEGEAGDLLIPEEVPLEMPMPESVIFHKFRIAADCLVDTPAFPEAVFELIGDIAIPPVRASEVPVEDDELEAVVAAGYTITIPDCPPPEWFSRPTDAELTAGALTITDEGRLYGWLAPPGVAHQGRADRIMAPQGVDYSRFLRGEVLCADGSRVIAGNLTMDCGHAPLSRDLHQAAEHYDNTCSVFAQINVGEYKGGTWMAGAILPDVAPSQVRRALSCQASGDWRARDDGRHGRKLAAALIVPVPGFAKGRNRATSKVQTENGELQLVASAVPIHFQRSGADARNQKIADRIARSVRLDYKSRADALAARVQPIVAARAPRVKGLSKGTVNRIKVDRMASSLNVTAANDHHDERGRFGSKNGGGSSDAPSKSADKSGSLPKTGDLEGSEEYDIRSWNVAGNIAIDVENLGGAPDDGALVADHAAFVIANPDAGAAPPADLDTGSLTPENFERAVGAAVTYATNEMEMNGGNQRDAANALADISAYAGSEFEDAKVNSEAYGTEWTAETASAVVKLSFRTAALLKR